MKESEIVYYSGNDDTDTDGDPDTDKKPDKYIFSKRGRQALLYNLMEIKKLNKYNSKTFDTTTCKPGDKDP